MKILVPYPTAHEIPSGVTTVLNGISKEISQTHHIIIIRLIFQSEKISNLPKNDKFNQVIDLHNFQNAFDAINSIKPDLIYGVPHKELIGHSFLFASKYLGIPTIGLVFSGFDNNLQVKSNLFSSFKKIFDNSVPTDIYVNKKSFLRRLNFILYKILFLKKTYSQIYNPFLSLLKIVNFLSKSFSGDPFQLDFPLTKSFVLNKFQKQFLVKLGFTDNDVIVTGHPMFDDDIKKNLKTKYNFGKTKNFLFAPDTLAESKIWTKQKQDETINEILSILNDIPNSNIILKVHPASSKLEYFKKYTKKINNKIEIHQKGSIVSYFENADFLVVYSLFSSSVIKALIHKIPIIFYNVDDELNDPFFLKSTNLIYECKNFKQFSEILNNLKNLDGVAEKNRSEYISNYLYSDDGNASKRISDEILKLLNKI